MYIYCSLELLYHIHEGCVFVIPNEENFVVKQLSCKNKANCDHEDVCYQLKYVNDKQIVVIVENLMMDNDYDVTVKTNEHEYSTSVRIYGTLLLQYH